MKNAKTAYKQTAMINQGIALSIVEYLDTAGVAGEALGRGALVVKNSSLKR